MKNSIPRYTFYKHKYGSELLVDVVELKYVKKFLAKSAVHTLNYYDITFITEGEGRFVIGHQTYNAVSRDVFFSRPGEIRSWEINCIKNGYALIFEDELNSATNSLKLKQTNIRHISSISTLSSSGNPRLIEVKGLEEQNDGNNVNLDTQMGEMSKNKVLFDAIQSSIKKDSRLFRSVVESSAKN